MDEDASERGRTSMTHVRIFPSDVCSATGEDFGSLQRRNTSLYFGYFQYTFCPLDGSI